MKLLQGVECDSQGDQTASGQEAARMDQWSTGEDRKWLLLSLFNSVDKNLVFQPKLSEKAIFSPKLK